MTGCERVLRLLADGRPHSHTEGYRLNVILHSRVSDLRKRGHQILCWREGDQHLYQLVSSSSGPSIPGEASQAERDHAQQHRAGGGRPLDDYADKSPLGDAGPPLATPGGSAGFAVPALVLVAAESAAPVEGDGVNRSRTSASPSTQLDLFGVAL